MRNSPKIQISKSFGKKKFYRAGGGHDTFFFSPSPNRKNSFHWVDGEEIKTAGFNIHQFENIKIGGNDGSNIGACITR